MSSTNTPLDALFSVPAVDKQGNFTFQVKQYLQAQNILVGELAPTESPVFEGTVAAPLVNITGATAATATAGCCTASPTRWK